MKKITLSLICLLVGAQLFAQNYYWVFFTDKSNTTFDPYQYFDAKAIERYQQNQLDLYDISNYPVNQSYVNQVNDLTEQYVGQSRWFNAMAVTATEDQMAAVQLLPFVAGTQLIATEAVPTSTTSAASAQYDATMNQLALMQGEKFQQRNINGKGVRIAIFDGGFPDVNTHPAFKHLRDNNQIIKTWNFANGKENVYGYNDHGRMVLSCIAGIMNDTTLLGLAPAAEFLLARTEVEEEKKKEEIWWVEALEWADQNGASIVNSSLGYGKELHYLKEMDGKTSIVAQGARTAASKGILVCTAMGNEGMDGRWKMLVTPADADSVLSVGAVRSLEQRESYSSFGPTADGRRKPNVVACGYDMVAADKGNYEYAQGTSFATPLVAGFAACVKQMHPEWSVMQLLEEIEKSANHYPYYDYAFGYGVPQAGYFTENIKPSKHSFDLQEDAEYIYIVPVDPESSHKIFYNIQNGDGSIENYEVKSIVKDTTYSKPAFFISKKYLEMGQTVNIWFDNQYATYVVGKDKVTPKDPEVVAQSLIFDSDFVGCGSSSKPSKCIYTRNNGKEFTLRLVLNASFMLPSMWTPDGNIHQTDRISRSFFFSFENNWQLARVYGLGFRLGFGSSWYALKEYTDPAGNWAENHPDYDLSASVKKFNMKTSQFDLELYQRFVLTKRYRNNLYIDTGVFGDWITGSHLKCKTQMDGNNIKSIDKRYYRDGINKLDCGVRLRIGFKNVFAIYGQYRITDIIKEGNDLPKWEVGVQIF